MGRTAIPMEADTGPIGGDMSHEFIILAETGESGVYFHKDWLNTNMVADISFEEDLQPVVDKFTSLYAKTDEMHDPADCDVADADLMEKRGIEVGHIFYFGTKYSEPMGATVQGRDGKPQALHMGSYGIGVSRLVGGIIEASHDDRGIIWPEAVAPFDVAIINLKPGHEEADKVSNALYDEALGQGYDALLDDSSESAGAKMATMDLIGVPWHIILGPRSLDQNQVEVKSRRTGESVAMSPESALNFIAEQKNS